MYYLINRIRIFFREGHERTLRAKRNILQAILFRGLGVLIGFAYFPISLSYLGEAKFGIFLTLTSIIDWFSEMDVGIGHGLRNRLGESLADGDREKARGYVSTAYFALGSIFSGVTVVFLVVSYFLPWADLLQADPSLNGQIALLAVLMCAAFAVRFVSSMIYEVFYALQRIAMVDLFSLLTKLSFLGFIIALFYLTKESLLLFGVAKTFTFALAPFMVGLYYFRRELSYLRPSIRLVKKAYFRSMFSLGFRFFFIRIAFVIIHHTNNFLIAGFVSLEAVPQYEAAYKYLSIFLMLFVILTNQLWAANIEAYRKGDLEWMRRSILNVTKVWLGTVLLAMMMVAVSPIFYQLWLGEKMEMPWSLTVVVAISITVTNWVNMFNLVLNGASKVTLQMYAWLFAGVVNIPASIFFARFLGWGVNGIVVGTIVSLIPLAILSPLQVQKILAGKDRGIWSK